MTSPPDKRLLIQGLARRGGMKHERPGQYFSENATSEFKAEFPTYDIMVIRAAFPNVLEIDVVNDVDDETGEPSALFAVLKDGNNDLEVPLGLQLPATTEGLIEKVRVHLRTLIDVASLRETTEVFDGLDDE